MTAHELMLKLSAIVATHGPDVEVFVNDQDGDRMLASEVECGIMYWHDPNNGDLQIFIS